jgi:hypothetical protein
MVTQILKRNNDLASILLVDSFKEADLFLMIFAIELTTFFIGPFRRVDCSKVNN